MTELNKLRNTLKEVPEIKESLEELKFGARVTYDYFGKTRANTFIGISPNNRRQVIHTDIGCASTGKVSTFNKKDLISISNPLQERHLRVYCEKKYIIYMVKGIFTELWFGSKMIQFKLDNTKDLQDQSEETLKSINDFITNLKIEGKI